MKNHQQDQFEIFKPDTRVPTFNNAVIKLEFQKDGKTHRGTGFLIDPTTIITAAHNINKTTILAEISAKIVKMPTYGDPSSKDRPNPRDLALIKLHGPGIVFGSDSYIKLKEGPNSAKCWVIGYPAGPGRNEPQKGAEGDAKKGNNGLYGYVIDTEGGQSGGPLLASGKQNAIGVHIFGDKDKSKSNYAAAITAEFMRWVDENRKA